MPHWIPVPGADLKGGRMTLKRDVPLRLRNSDLQGYGLHLNFESQREEITLRLLETIIFAFIQDSTPEQSSADDTR